MQPWSTLILHAVQLFLPAPPIPCYEGVKRIEGRCWMVGWYMKLIAPLEPPPGDESFPALARLFAYAVAATAPFLALSYGVCLLFVLGLRALGLP